MNGDWMQTFTGRKVWPLDLTPDQIDIRDIAHSLAYQCRFNGAVREFYSVAQHSVIASLISTPAYALGALLHDSAETYLIDIPRPVKGFLIIKVGEKLLGYCELEMQILHVIGEAFNCLIDVYSLEEIDGRLALTEGSQLLNGSTSDWELSRKYSPYSFRIRPWSPEKAEAIFLALFECLIGRRANIESCRFSDDYIRCAEAILGKEDI